MVVLTISGPAGAGKSTVSEILIKRFNIGHYSAGHFFRMKAKEAGMTVKEFMKVAPKELHLEADKSLDDLSKKGNVLLEGRLSGYMASRADFRIFLTAPLEIRAKRVALLEGISTKEAANKISERDKKDAENYMEVYGINVDDLKIYDLVLNTRFFTKYEVVNLIEKIVRVALKI